MGGGVGCLVFTMNVVDMVAQPVGPDDKSRWWCSLSPYLKAYRAQPRSSCCHCWGVNATLHGTRHELQLTQPLLTYLILLDNRAKRAIFSFLRIRKQYFFGCECVCATVVVSKVSVKFANGQNGVNHFKLASILDIKKRYDLIVLLFMKSSRIKLKVVENYTNLIFLGMFIYL